MRQGSKVSVLCQVVNRDKLQRAGEDNLFVRLLYAKDKPQIAQTRDEQEKLGVYTPHLLQAQFDVPDNRFTVKGKHIAVSMLHQYAA